MTAKSLSTQNFVPIKEIREGVVVLKNGQMNVVLLASSINIALKSAEMQEAVLHQFQSFLNTLDFSIQFYVQSRRLHIGPYLELLRGRESEQDNDLMRIQLREYTEFIRTFVNEVDIMKKNFFVIIPYTPLPVNLGSGLGGLFGGSSKQTGANSLDTARVQLGQRVSLVEQGLNRMGIRTIALQDQELVELYYHLFNPEDIGGSAPTG